VLPKGVDLDAARCRNTTGLATANLSHGAGAQLDQVLVARVLKDPEAQNVPCVLAETPIAEVQAKQIDVVRTEIGGIRTRSHIGWHREAFEVCERVAGPYPIEDVRRRARIEHSGQLLSWL
jgi:hypothetical protein